MMNSRITISLATSFVAAMTAVATAQEFVTIDPLPGDDWIRIKGVSEDGTVAAGTSYAGSWANGRAFIWTIEDGATALPSNGNNSYVADMSDDGSTVIGGISGGTPVRWVNSTLEIIEPTAEVPWFGVIAVSGDGNVIVGEGEADGEVTAVRWTPDGYTPITGFKPGAYTFATAVSQDGNVITGLSEYDAAEAFSWSEDEGLRWLGFLPGGSWHSTTVAVSGDGSVLAGQSHVSPDNYAAAYWQDGAGWTEIPSDIPSASFANAVQSVTADGSVMVGYYTGSDPSAWEMFIYDQTNGARSLKQTLSNDYGIDFGNWNIDASGIANVGVSADGSAFYGSTVNPDTGEEGSWIAFTEPATPAGDLNNDGNINVSDMLLLLGAWGECGKGECPADLNGNGTVDVSDLLMLLGNWG